MSDERGGDGSGDDSTDAEMLWFERLVEVPDQDDVPVAHQALANLLIATRVPPTEHELAGESAAVALFRSAQGHGKRSRVGTARMSTSLIVAATLTVVTVTGAAAAGRLPADAQDITSGVLAKIGIHIPDSERGLSPTGDEPVAPLTMTPGARSTPTPSVSGRRPDAHSVIARHAVVIAPSTDGPSTATSTVDHLASDQPAVVLVTSVTEPPGAAVAPAGTSTTPAAAGTGLLPTPADPTPTTAIPQDEGSNDQPPAAPAGAEARVTPGPPATLPANANANANATVDANARQRQRQRHADHPPAANANANANANASDAPTPTPTPTPGPPTRQRQRQRQRQRPQRQRHANANANANAKADAAPGAAADAASDHPRP